MLPLYLGDILVCHMKSVLLLHPRLNLFIRSALLKPGHVHVFEREFHSDILTRYVSLGKLYNRLNVRPFYILSPSVPDRTENILLRLKGVCSFQIQRLFIRIEREAHADLIVEKQFGRPSVHIEPYPEVTVA